MYVEALIGPDTVNTIPPPTLAAFRDHGHVALRLLEGMGEAMENLKELAEAGVDLNRVTEDLEKAGVQSFADSYNKIIQLIRGKK